MLPLLAIGLALGSIPGEGDAEPVGFLLTANVGALPRAVLELEKPVAPWASAFLSLGSANLTDLNSAISGPQVAVGGRVFVFGRGPWGLFLDGRLLANLYFPAGEVKASEPFVLPGAAITVGFTAKLWHAVVSPGLSLFYVPEPGAASVLFPALRLAVGGWNLAFDAASGESDEEPVGFLLTADLGAAPRVALELEAPMVRAGSAFISLGYPVPIGVYFFSDRTPGPQIAAGWRLYLSGRAPWGLFLDGRLLASLYFPLDPLAPSPAVFPGGGLTLGLNVKAWHAVVSPGISLLYTSDPAAIFPVLPALRLAVGGWN